MKSLTRTALLGCALIHASFGNTVGSSEVSTQSPAAPTCPARTVNYLTHSLVQQCRTSSWKSTQVATTSPSNDPQRNPTGTQATPVSDTSTDSEQARFTTTKAPSSETVAYSNTASKDNEISKAEQDPIPTSHITTETEAAQTETETDAESPLKSGNFLSFEEWKKQNLAKHGQSADYIGRAREYPEPRKRPPNLNAALDSLDDEAEIELNFPGFTPEVPNSEDLPRSQQTDAEASISVMETGDGPPKAMLRSKDAGKTCKERFNYASFDCAAAVRKTNSQASGSTSVLVENKDSYMLNQCSADNKFIIVELCDDIAIDTIVLANYEFFSSIFRSLRVSVSDRYPVKLDKWKTIGTYEARNSREVQAFLVENPVIWARYLRIEFLTHYGNEFYCPISLIRVHGATMLEDYKRHEDAARAEEEGDYEGTLEIDEGAVSRGEEHSPEAVAETVRAESVAEKEVNASLSTDDQLLQEKSTSNGTTLSTESASALDNPSPTTTNDHIQRSPGNATALLIVQPSLCPTPATVTSRPIQPHITTSTVSIDYNHQSESKSPQISQSSPQTSQNTSVTQSNASKNQSSGESIATANVTKPTSTKSTNKTSVVSSDAYRTAGSNTQPAPANPTIQESFFKSVQKRLQMLEANSSLSLQYIEDQSRILRDAFNKVEQRQLAKTTSFIDYLNSTVLSELRDFRQQYDQIWQSTVIELEGQREQYQRDMTAMNARLGMLAEEVIFQKRLSILQSILVLLCLGLVLFSRGGVANYLEHPIVQNVMGRSQSFRFGSSMEESPVDSPLTTRPNSAFRFLKPSLSSLRGHSRRISGDSRQLSSSPAADYASMSRSTEAQASESEPSEGSMEEKRAPSPSPSLSALERPGTSPAALASGSESIEGSLSSMKWNIDDAGSVRRRNEDSDHDVILANGEYTEELPEALETQLRERSETITQNSNGFIVPVAAKS